MVKISAIPSKLGQQLIPKFRPKFYRHFATEKKDLQLQLPRHYGISRPTLRQRHLHELFQRPR